MAGSSSTHRLHKSPRSHCALQHLAYQPKSRERSCRPTKHGTFARNWMTTKMTNLLFVQIALLFRKKMKMINFWCNFHPRWSVTLLQYAEFLHRYEEESRLATLEQDVSGTSCERSEDVSGLGKNSDGEAVHKLSDERNMKDIHLKHYHMSWHVQVYDLHQHAVKTCLFFNSTKPTSGRSRVSGLRAEEFGDLIFLDHGSTNIGNKTFFSDCFGLCYFAFDSISM